MNIDPENMPDPEELTSAIREFLDEANLDDMVRESMEMARKYPQHMLYAQAKMQGGVLHEFLTQFLPHHELGIVQMKDGQPVGLVDIQHEESVNDMIAHFFGLDMDAYEEEERVMNGDSADVHDPELDDAIAAFEEQFNPLGARDWDAEMAEAMAEEE